MGTGAEICRKLDDLRKEVVKAVRANPGGFVLCDACGTLHPASQAGAVCSVCAAYHMDGSAEAVLAQLAASELRVASDHLAVVPRYFENVV